MYWDVKTVKPLPDFRIRVEIEDGRTSPEFQAKHGYASDRFTHELLSLASKYVGHTFGCVSLTLEIPFKDNADLPDEACGWSAQRSKRLGAAVLQPVLAHLLSD